MTRLLLRLLPPTLLVAGIALIWYYVYHLTSLTLEGRLLLTP